MLEMRKGEDPIISPDWVYEHHEDDHVRIVDCRFTVGDPNRGKREYGEGHLPGAVYIDLEREMTGEKGIHGGRHPLPDLNGFAALLGRLGIANHHTVIAYDDEWGENAGRFWFIMKLLGHRSVNVLDGGLTLWGRKGYPFSQEVAKFPPTHYIRLLGASPLLVEMDEVRRKIGSKGTILIDSRAHERYIGATEPLDPVAGHIPGARNFFYQEVIVSDGRWKSASQLRDHFSPLDPEKEMIVYCGSGVTATPNLISLLRAGYKNVRLYAGSWSDWISYPENPIATGEE